jgi:hypothetical protein
LYDRRAVVVGTRSGTAIIGDRQEVQSYEQLFTMLEKIAVFGEDARALILRITDDYRALTDAAGFFREMNRNHRHYYSE